MKIKARFNTATSIILRKLATGTNKSARQRHARNPSSNITQTNLRKPISFRMLFVRHIMGLYVEIAFGCYSSLG